jgi:hypothetical protein
MAEEIRIRPRWTRPTRQQRRAASNKAALQIGQRLNQGGSYQQQIAAGRAGDDANGLELPRN